MQTQGINISFNQRQVTVQSNASEVLDGLKKCFGSMISSSNQSVIGKIDVLRKDNIYFINVAGDKNPYSKPSLEEILSYVEHEISVQLIRSHPKYLWFHSGAVTDSEKAVMFLGNWGSGKSTLVTSLCDLGWKFLSDDIVPVDPVTGWAYPFPRSPRVRKNLGIPLASKSVQMLPKIDITVTSRKIYRQSVSIGAFVFPMYNFEGKTCVKPISPGKAALKMIQNCLNFSTHGSNAVGRVIGLLKRVPAYRLFYQDGPSAAELIIKEI